MSIIFLHIPHTSGRVLKEFIGKNKLDIGYVHNFYGLKAIRNKEYDTIYTIIRNPLDRAISEYVHYSRLLMNQGWVNHLAIAKIRRTNPFFNPAVPKHYFGLEENKNVMCKFMLRKTDFTKPMNDDDYKNVISLINSGNIKYDIYNKFNNELPIFSKLIEWDTDKLIDSMNELRSNYKEMSSVVKKQWLNNESLCEFIKKENSYDFKLFNYLS